MESYSKPNPLAVEESVGIARRNERQKVRDDILNYAPSFLTDNNIMVSRNGELVETSIMDELAGFCVARAAEKANQEELEIKGVEEQEHVSEYLRRKIGYQGLYNILNGNKD